MPTRKPRPTWEEVAGNLFEATKFDARVGGALRYDTIADTPEMIAAMKEMGQPPSHATRARFTGLERIAWMFGRPADGATPRGPANHL